MTEELKPCPFCGGKALCDTDIKGFWFVACPDDYCNMRVSTYHYGSKQEAIVAWNTRYSPIGDNS